MRKLKLAMSVALMMVLLIVSACGKSESTNSSGSPDSGSSSPAAAEASNAVETSKITFGTARDLQLASIIIVAKEEGYFAEEGLDAEVQLMSNGSDVAAAVAGGSISIASLGDSPTSVLVQSGTEIEIIAHQSNISGAQALIVNPDVIKTPQDLNGKKVAYSSGNTSELLFLSIVDKYGLDPKSMEIFKMGAPEMLTAFEKKDVDAFVIWEPIVNSAMKLGGHRLVSGTTSYVPGEEGEQKLIGAHSLLIASKKFADSNPNTMKAILRAMNKAVKFIDENIEAAAAHTSAALQMEAADAVEIMKVNAYSLEMTPEIIEDIKGSAQFLKDNGKISELPDFEKIVNSSYLN